MILLIASGSRLNTPNASATVCQKLVKGDLPIFSPKCSTIVPLLKEYFPFLYVEPFGYDNSPNGGIVKYLAKVGAISPPPRK